MATRMEAGKYDWMKVIDVMSKNPVTVRASESVGQADEIMSDHGIRQLPVVHGNELLGIITDRIFARFSAVRYILLLRRERKRSIQKLPM